MLQGHPNPLDGIQPAVKSALTRAYNKGSSSRVVRAADLITLPGIKKAPKKRVAAMLEPLDDNVAEENEEAPSDTDDQGMLFCYLLIYIVDCFLLLRKCNCSIDSLSVSLNCFVSVRFPPFSISCFC